MPRTFNFARVFSVCMDALYASALINLGVQYKSDARNGFSTGLNYEMRHTPARKRAAKRYFLTGAFLHFVLRVRAFINFYFIRIYT
jgi:hypothetical protein